MNSFSKNHKEHKIESEPLKMNQIDYLLTPAQVEEYNQRIEEDENYMFSEEWQQELLAKHSEDRHIIEYVYYTGKGSNKDGKHTLQEFMTIMTTQFQVNYEWPVMIAYAGAGIKWIEQLCLACNKEKEPYQDDCYYCEVCELLLS